MSHIFGIRIQSSFVSSRALLPFPSSALGARSFVCISRGSQPSRTVTVSAAAAAAASRSRALRPHRHSPLAATAPGQEMAQGGKPALGWAATDATGVLSPYSFSRRYVFSSSPCLLSTLLLCPRPFFQMSTEGWILSSYPRLEEG